jgi:hypothetical protein
MPFHPGQSGNPLGGKRKRQWIAEKQRIAAARKAWERLLRLQDDMVLERKEIKGADGEPISVDVVPSAKDYIACCKEILNRAGGVPRVEGDEPNDPDKAVLFIGFMHSLVSYLNAKDPQALEYLEFHIRGFAAEMKLGALPTVQPVPANHRPQLR